LKKNARKKKHNQKTVHGKGERKNSFDQNRWGEHSIRKKREQWKKRIRTDSAEQNKVVNIRHTKNQRKRKVHRERPKKKTCSTQGDVSEMEEKRLGLYS